MTIYGLGFLAVVLLFALLYAHAYQLRAQLDLNALEVYRTRESILVFLLMGAVAIVSVLVAVIGGPGYTSWSGYTYALIGPVRTIHASIAGDRSRELEKRISTEAEETT